MLKNAASKAECGGCIVHYVLCVCSQHACGTTSFFFATTPRIEPNVNTGLRTTRGLMWTFRLCRPRRSYKYSDASGVIQSMLNLVTKNPDIIRAKLIFAGDALPEQPFGSPRKCFRASQKHFGADLTLLEGSRSVLELLWDYLGAILELRWSVSSTTVAKGRFPSLCQSPILKDVSNEITIHRGSGQIGPGRGGGGLPGRWAQRGRPQRGSDSLTRLFTPFRGRRISTSRSISGLTLQ